MLGGGIRASPVISKYPVFSCVLSTFPWFVPSGSTLNCTLAPSHTSTFPYLCLLSPCSDFSPCVHTRPCQSPPIPTCFPAFAFTSQLLLALVKITPHVLQALCSYPVDACEMGALSPASLAAFSLRQQAFPKFSLCPCTLHFYLLLRQLDTFPGEMERNVCSPQIERTMADGRKDSFRVQLRESSWVLEFQEEPGQPSLGKASCFPFVLWLLESQEGSRFEKISERLPEPP